MILQAPSNAPVDAENQTTTLPLKFPYTIEINVTGLFAFDPSTEIDGNRTLRMVAFNGLSMLYGFARDIVLQMTALGEHGPFMLPATNLADIASSLSEAVPPPATSEPEASAGRGQGPDM